MSISTSWPNLTGDRLNFNSKQFINDLANMAGDDNWDGWVRKGDIEDILKNENQTIEYPLNPSDFKNVGDKRFSLENVLKATYDEFIPRIKAYEEVLAAGGCQIINEYICDTDGNPIIKATPICTQVANKIMAGTSMGAVNVKPITAQEVSDFINENWKKAVESQANSFINYIKTNYINKKWNIELNDVQEFNIFYIKATLGQKNEYIKYYYNEKDYIAKGLNSKLKVVSPFKGDILSPHQDATIFMTAMQAEPLLF